MLKKYKLVGTFEGGVDHLIDGRRIPVSENITDEQAEILIKAGLPYFETIQDQLIEADGQTNENHENDENSGSDVVEPAGGNGDQPAPAQPTRKLKASRNVGGNAN